MVSEKKNSYFEILSILENLLDEANREKAQPIPIKIKYKSPSLDLKKDKPFVIVFGEQHLGSAINEINFIKTNKSILNTLTVFAKSKDITLGKFIKEGCSELKPYKKLQQKTTEELLRFGLSPLQVFINKIDPQKQVITVESQEIFIEFALLSLLYASRPGNARFSEIESQRIVYLISDNLDYEKYLQLKSKTQKIIEQLKLYEYFEEKFIKKINIENDFAELRLLALRSNIEEKVSKETLQEFDLRINKALLECGKLRDKKAAEAVAELDPGIYPMFFGDYHTQNLIEAFKEFEIPILVLSPFI